MHQRELWGGECTKESVVVVLLFLGDTVPKSLVCVGGWGGGGDAAKIVLGGESTKESLGENAPKRREFWGENAPKRVWGKNAPKRVWGWGGCENAPKSFGGECTKESLGVRMHQRELGGGVRGWGVPRCKN